MREDEARSLVASASNGGSLPGPAERAVIERIMRLPRQEQACLRAPSGGPFWFASEAGEILLSDEGETGFVYLVHDV
jgi:hypothetical protein